MIRFNKQKVSATDSWHSTSSRRSKDQTSLARIRNTWGGGMTIEMKHRAWRWQDKAWVWLVWVALGTELEYIVGGGFDVH